MSDNFFLSYIVNSLHYNNYLQFQNSKITQSLVMGCQVVPTYADQTHGILKYPQQILNDLYSRNYSPGNLLKLVPSQHSYYILGFNQSYAQSRLFTYVLAEKQYFVYSAGRFLVVLQNYLIKNHESIGKQRSIMHQDKIIALDMKGKLCLTGTVGGRIILWDLQFFQQKLNIKLPAQTLIISSLSLTSTSIFCTNSQQQNSTVSCFDIRTGKLKAASVIPTLQPVLKGINWGSNRHVTVGADGVWFCRFSQTDKAIQIIKGMFRIYPKTSMTCICVVNQTYLITGSVDGYVFLWAHNQCQKVLKVGDHCLTDMYLHKNKLITSNIVNNIRIFQYTIKPKKSLQQSQKQNGQITDDFISVIIDSYEKQSLQCIVISKLQQNIYYAQTRSGLMYDKMIPSSQFVSKIGYFKNLDRKIIEFQKETDKYIYQNQDQDRQELWLIKYNKPIFQIRLINLLNIQPKQWSISNRYISNSKKYIQTQDIHLFTFIPKIQRLCYFGLNKVYISEIINISQFPDIKLSQIKQQQILEFQHEGTNALVPRGITSVVIKENVYIILYFQKEYMVIKQRQNQNKWVRIIYEQYQKQMMKQLEIQGVLAKFQLQNNVFRCVNTKFPQDVLYKTSVLHCVHEIQDIAKLKSGKMLSLGGGVGLIK